jgi:four helix bundle protein
MNKPELELRAKQFALDSFVFASSVGGGRPADVLCARFLESASSVGAHYREANRAESKDDFIRMISMVEKEADASRYWLELMEGLSLGDAKKRTALLGESAELLAVFAAIGKTAKRNRNLYPAKVAVRKPR